MRAFRYLFIFILLSLLSFQLYPKEVPFTLERLIVDFNGVTFNDNVIIAYATNGIILYSLDRGNKWDQISIADDNCDIKKIVYDSNYFYGILDNNKFVKSTDNIRVWQTIENNNNIAIKDIAVSEEKIYLLSDNNIYICDINFNIQDSIEINYMAKEILITKDYIFTSADQGILNKYDRNNNYKLEVINFEELGFCTNCASTNILKEENNNIYVTISSILLKSSDYGNTWKKYDKTFTSPIVENDTIYSINLYSYIKNNYSELFFYRYEENQDTLIQVSKDTLIRFLPTFLIINKKQFINKDTIIIVGNDKLIYMSYNKGENWDLKSFIPKKNSIDKNLHFVDDSIMFYSRELFFNYVTKNSGVTWLPQFKTDTNYGKKYNLLSFYHTYSDNNKNVFSYVETSAVGIPNFIYSHDNGNTYIMTIKKELKGLPISSNNCLYTDSLFYLYLGFPDYNCTNMFIIDKEFNFLNRIEIDSLVLLNIKKIDDNGNLIAFTSRLRNPENQDDNTKDYFISYSSDWGITWDNKIKLEYKSYKISTSYIADDYILYCSNDLNKLCSYYYKYDLKNNQTYIFYNDTTLPMSQVKKINNALYVTTNSNKLLYNEDFENNMTNWEIYNINSNYYTISFNDQNTNKPYIFAIENSFQNMNIFKINPKISSNIIDESNEIATQLWASAAYPQPANEYVKAKIYWDLRYDIEDAEIGIYNVLGNKIAGKGSIMINKLQTYSGELYWKCGNMVQGIYFIKINHGDAVKTIPIVIER